MALLKFCKLLVLVLAVYSLPRIKLCLAAEESPNDNTLNWRSSFRSVESIPLREISWWENYLPNVSQESDSSSEIPTESRSFLSDGLDEEAVIQITKIIKPLDQQIGSLTTEIIKQVIDIFFSVDPSLRKKFTEMVVEQRIFHLSHSFHCPTFNINTALNYLGGLALTFSWGSSSRIGFLDYSTSFSPNIQQIVSLW